MPWLSRACNCPNSGISHPEACWCKQLQCSLQVQPPRPPRCKGSLSQATATAPAHAKNDTC
eukprot:9852926-Alexandrium_andersonii.AAC.1